METKIKFDNSNKASSMSPDYWILVVEMNGPPNLVDLVNNHIRELMKKNNAVEF